MSAARPEKFCKISVLLLGCVLLLSACGIKTTVVEPTFLEYTPSQTPENQLLDIGIELFDVGEVDPEDIAEGKVNPHIRKAEARYIPYHLKNTLQNSGYWGAVSVVPGDTQTVDVHVRGEIRESDGSQLVLRIKASDAFGGVWFEREYEAYPDVVAFANTQVGEHDLYQDLYNTIANDLVIAKNQLAEGKLKNMRQLALMRYAAETAPDAFADYVHREDENFELTRLPGDQDPMLQRVLAVREREYMLIDSLNAHYDRYYHDMWDSYENWRRARFDEAASLKAVEDEANDRFLLGAGAILAAIALEVMGDGNGAFLRNAMLVGGGYALKTGFDKLEDSKIHSQAIQELDQSFESEVTPMVIDVEGRTLKLTGSAEEQFRLWRIVLKEIYQTELGQTAVQSDTVAPTETGALPEANTE